MSSVLIDTGMWSLTLRGKKSKEIDVAQQITQLIHENKTKIIGPIHQDVLPTSPKLRQR